MSPENSPERNGLNDILGDGPEFDREMAVKRYDDLINMMRILVNKDGKESIRGNLRLIKGEREADGYFYTFRRDQNLETGDERGRIVIKNSDKPYPYIKLRWEQETDSELGGEVRKVRLSVVRQGTEEIDGVPEESDGGRNAENIDGGRITEEVENLGSFEIDLDDITNDFDQQNGTEVEKYIYWIGNSVFGMYGRDQKHQEYLDRGGKRLEVEEPNVEEPVDKLEEESFDDSEEESLDT